MNLFFLFSYYVKGTSPEKQKKRKVKELATILNNAATLTYNSGENTGSAASNVVSTSLLDSYSITAAKFTANDSFRPGENITYLVTVTNTGTQPVFAVQITDNLGGGIDAPLAFVQNSALVIEDGGVIQVVPVSVDPLTITLADELLSGESITVVYVAQVNSVVTAGVEMITNTVEATARQGSATGEVVQAEPTSVTIEREEFAQVGITKAVDKAVIASGDTLTYTFTIENSGNIEATNVVITDTLPEEFTITAIRSETNGVVTVYDPTDYTVGADNTLVLPTGNIAITVPPRTAAGNGVTTITVEGTVTG